MRPPKHSNAPQQPPPAAAQSQHESVRAQQQQHEKPIPLLSPRPAGAFYTRTLEPSTPHSDQLETSCAAFGRAQSKSLRPSKREQQSTIIDLSAARIDEDDSIQLVDLSTSPPNETATYPYQVAVHSRSSLESLGTKRSSLAHSSGDFSYSRSSSSEDSGSYSSHGSSGLRSASTHHFDDELAENFVIKFPADDCSPIRHKSLGDCVIQLPLSETEPLLTNIEATIADKQRSICLSKNSASLIFTKKELAPSAVRFFGGSSSNSNSNSNSSSNNNKGSQRRHQYHHQSLRAAHDYHAAKVPTKHLPATYDHQQQQQARPRPQHQHQRRSLQLNYNNNLVTTSACGANNNYCSGSECVDESRPKSLHRHAQPAPAPASAVTATATSSSAASRKQHAYSWYAPVYTALEEELEQDSRNASPIHNLANTKKQQSAIAAGTLYYPRPHVHAYAQTQAQPQSQPQSNLHHRSSRSSSASPGPDASADNETVALLESRNHINIQAQAQQPRDSGGGSGSGSGSGGVGGAAPPTTLPLPLPLQSNESLGYDLEGTPGSLGLNGTQLPRRRRFENFIKSLVGLKSSSRHSSHSNISSNVIGGGGGGGGGGVGAIASDGPQSQGGQPHVRPLPPSPEITITRTPSDQDVVMRREPAGRQQLKQQRHRRSSDRLSSGDTGGLLSQGSTSSLNMVQQKLWNMLRREGSASSLHNEKSQSVVQYTGMRKCETVLALTRQTSAISSHPDGSTAAHEARFSVSGGDIVRSTRSGIFSPSGVEQIRPLNRLRVSATSMNAVTCSRCSSLLSLAANGSHYSLNVSTHSGAGASFVQAPNGGLGGLVSGSVNCSRKSSEDTQTRSDSISSPSNVTTATLNCSLTAGTPTTTCPSPPPVGGPPLTSASSPVASPTSNSNATLPTSTSGPGPVLPGHAYPLTTLLSLPIKPASPRSDVTDGAPSPPAPAPAPAPAEPIALQTCQSAAGSSEAPPFQSFTCKLCLIDVETACEATTLQQCGCEFCTECMRAYVEFEISEGAHEISCPDAQCAAQGILLLSEIASLTTTNLMKKHHRYRLNREIELDKTRTWCPRAGCETVCMVGSGSHSDAAPSTSSSTAAKSVTIASPTGEGMVKFICAVHCPSCREEFCSACKKAWHPNTSCEENSRRLVADGQDDIGIPFDNELIKCCPMCAVPIEKDEGCAQMMCKRCKHVFCWYCLASLDDDFLLRHYDKGPCKNKLGHSRASVVWHRAQVIGIFAGFGILLLVASPLLLLAAPCIICCKCRSCSGSKIDEGDGELDEATALQS